MARTRAAILDAAASCVERYGVRRTTMGDVAGRGGIAKATLYNHFRAKDDLLAALVEARVSELAETCEAVAAGRGAPDPAPGVAAADLGAGLAAALRYAAAALSSSGPLRRVAADEPALLVRLATPGEGHAWALVRGGVGRVLSAAGVPAADPAVDAVLRWLLGQLLWPATPSQAAFGAQLLAQGLGAAGTALPAPAPEPARAEPAPAAPAPAAPEPPAEPAPAAAAHLPAPAADPAPEPPVSAPPAGLGWPA